MAADLQPEHGRERAPWRVWIAVALLLVGLAALRFGPRLAERLRPEPVAAFVALLPEGEELARDGRHELAAGRPFRLFAVLEARRPGGGAVWYTAAPRLALGGREIPAADLRRWPEDRIARVRWWTVEGFAPYLAAAAAADLERFRLVATFHPEWGADWAVAGLIDPRNAELARDSPLKPLPFGTQRFQARIELYSGAEAMTPSRSLASAGADEVLLQPERVTTVVAALPPPLAPVSRVFGLTQLEPGTELGASDEARVEAWRAAGLAFARAPLLAEHLAAAAAEAGALRWRAVDLGRALPAWDETRAAAAAVAAGDLLQSGERIVVLFRDEGARGRLDGADLVFDFVRGAKIRRVDEVFHLVEELVLEWARVGPNPA